MDSGSKKAVVLVSGGLDSATCLAVARSRGFSCFALSIHYGQRHAAELLAARRVARALGAASHVEVSVDLRAIGGSALTADIDVPKDRPYEQIDHGIPITYVPARNTIFLSIALGHAEVLGAFDIFLGVNALDYSGYPDCRPEFVRQFEVLANLATRAGDFIYVAGMRGIDPKTDTLVQGDEPRVRQAFLNMKRIAESEGATLRDAVRIVVYVTDMFRFRPIVNKVQSELWGEGPFPPRTIVEVQRLNQDDIVEVEGTFYAPRGAK